MQPMWPLGSVKRPRYPNGSVGQATPVTQFSVVLTMSTKPNLDSKSPVVLYPACVTLKIIPFFLLLTLSVATAQK